MRAALAARLIDRAGLRSVLSRAFRWAGVLVLNYHRIGNGRGSVFDRAVWSADTEAFSDQVRFCKSHFDVISPHDLAGVRVRGRGRYLLFTFDDGYRDNYEAAFPVLASEGIPATFFVATGFIDSPRLPWWDEIAWMTRLCRRRAIELPGWVPAPVRFDEPDREGAIRTLLRTYKAMPVDATETYLNDLGDAAGTGRYDGGAGARLWMTWDMLRQMRAAGMTIGGHTVNHPILAQAPVEIQHREIEECGHRLVSELSEPMRCFSYPVGGPRTFDSITWACLAAAGVQYAFSYCTGYRGFENWDDYDIGRVPVESYVTAGWFRSLVMLPRLFA